MSGTSPGDGTNQQAEGDIDGRKKLEKMYDMQNDMVNSLRKTAFQLANFYFVMQAVVFTALAGETSLICRDVWFPLILSLIPAFLNLFALVMIGKEYKDAYLYREETTCNIELLKYPQFGDDGSRITEIPTDPRRKRDVTIIFYACMIAFASFAIVVAIGSGWMLCREQKFVEDHFDDDAKCVELLCQGGKCIKLCPKS